MSGHNVNSEILLMKMVKTQYTYAKSPPIYIGKDFNKELVEKCSRLCKKLTPEQAKYLDGIYEGGNFMVSRHYDVINHPKDPITRTVVVPNNISEQDNIEDKDILSLTAAQAEYIESLVEFAEAIGYQLDSDTTIKSKSGKNTRTEVIFIVDTDGTISIVGGKRYV